jgi:ABC-type multidrug transport system ATPase subunit
MQTLSVTSVTKTFGPKKILTDVTLDCQTGDIFGIFGHNGCGKSTLLKIMFGTMKADTVSLRLNGKPLYPADVIPKKIIGYLPQDPFLPKSIKVRNIIPMYYQGNSQDKIFYAPGIHEMANRKAGELSMGQLRYLELLLVGNLEHPFLMLDEPFSMIEPLYKDRIKDLLNSLKATKGIILTDHYYRDVLDISNKNLLLKNGSAYTIQTANELADWGYLPAS